MVCLDVSQHSLRALGQAKDLMHTERGDHLVLFTVPQVVGHDPQMGGELSTLIAQERDKIVEEYMAQAEDQCRDVIGAFHTVIGLPSGGPRDEVLRVAEEEKCDFIVLGSRGLSPMKRVLVGSVSSYVVTHASCNVIVVQ